MNYKAMPRLNSTFVLFLTPALWGATFPAAKLAMEVLPPLAFMAWSRLLGVATIVVALPWLARAVERSSLRSLVWPGALLGGLIFVAYILQTWGLQITTATNAGFITGLYVVFTPLLGLVLFREATARAAWVAVAVSIVGLALLSTRSLDALRPRPGDLLVLASAVAWAGHVVALGRLAPHHPTRLLALAQMAATAAFQLIAAAFVGLRPDDALSVWPLLAVTGIFGSGIAYTLQIMVQKEVDATRAAIVLAAESLFSALLSAFWIGERLSPHQWLGAALVVAAMVLSELGARRRDVVHLEPGSAL